MNRNKIVDIIFCSTMLFMIFLAYTLSYISTTMGVMGEPKGAVSIESRIFEDVTYLSVWFAIFAVIYFVTKLYLTITRKTSVYFKYLDLSFCSFAMITFVVGVTGVIMKIGPPITTDVAWFRFVTIHILVPFSILGYLSYFHLNYIYSLKEILLAGIPNAVIVLVYVFWITFVFAKGVERSTNVGFPYPGVAAEKVGLGVYVSLIFCGLIGFWGVTSLGAVANNILLLKFRCPKYGQLYFKRDIFLELEQNA
ncbi:hypothetical protein SCHIN_v1c01200 [Spiroplasma chinense]|uniref:Transmembrane protein n=1 Tax=Spiroplasma chinense TaxID=216932 RepID=A0A5B9Y2Q2_9MOLU|nr:hypothetical protein [Spiroplasma chinense]QEH61318.1 hypothetical protein SCHIN_v1c01200 [Spiroplasma chinense]